MSPISAQDTSVPGVHTEIWHENSMWTFWWHMSVQSLSPWQGLHAFFGSRGQGSLSSANPSLS
jgi:hypothetical protein